MKHTKAKKKKKILRGPLHLQTGGAVANTPSVATGVPQGGYAAPAIQTYLSGAASPQYSTGPIGAGVVGQPVNTNYVPPVSTYVPPVVTPTTTTTNTGGGQGSGPAATQQFVPATVTNTTPAATYAGETYDTSQDTAGPLVTNPAVGETTTYTPEQLAEITTDLSQSSLIPTEERIAQNQANVNQIVADGNGLISAGPNILDASQTPEQYHQNFQGNYNAQYDHAQANPTGQSTGVPIYDQGFDFSDAGIDALLPPTGEAAPNAGSTAWGPLAGVENFLAGIGGKNVQDTRYGVTGNRTAQQQANLEAFQQSQHGGSITGDRGSASVRADKATEMANATVNKQAQEDYAAQGDPAAQAALAEERAKQRLAHTFKSDGHKAAEKAAKAAGVDLSWQDIQDLGKTSHEYSQAGVDSIRAEQQGIKAVDGGWNTPKTTAETAAGTDVLWNGQTRAQTQAQNLAGIDLTHESASSQRKDAADQAARLQAAQAVGTGNTQDTLAQLQAGVPAAEVHANIAAAQTEAWADASTLSGSEAKAWLNEQGLGNYAKEDARDAIASLKGDAGFNMGGPISLNYGGAVDPEEQRRRAEEAKIAQSRATVTPPQQKAPLQPQQVGGGQSPLLGIGAKLLGTAIGGPLGGILGGLFNEGGQVQELNQGGWLANLFGSGKPRTSRWGGEATKAPRTQTTGLPSRPLPSGINFTNPNRVKRDAAYAAHAKSGKPSIWEKLGLNIGGNVPMKGYNTGGPLAVQPSEYKAGGMGDQGMPVKKKMDLEKLESQKMMDQQKMSQAEKSFMMAEGRKDKAAEQAMMQKEEAHKQAMKLKADTARMGPLASKEG